MKLYHKNIFMPKVDMQKFWDGFERVNFTHHFMVRARQKRLPLVQKDKLSKNMVFEMAMSGDKIIKVCVRVPMRQCDFCYVVASNGSIITGWRAYKWETFDKPNAERYDKE